ncbi:EamA family transporter [Microvirga sesbaniae]|uniref:EamA family transporter n=1 Tax=Microvirga sesbaniae TaxID=681392 RepID=UPI0021C7C0A9|nr:EamA family transporter [Microvirga sp. HBU67692]
MALHSSLQAPVAPKLAPPASALLAMASITTGASFAKGLFPVLGPAGTAAVRLGLAALILAGLLRVWRVRPTLRSLGSGAVYGSMIAGMNLLFYMAIARIPLGVAIAIEFMGPLAVAIFASRHRMHLIWAALALAGLLMILPIRASEGSLDPVGVLYALGAGACWAGYILAGRLAGADHGIQAPAVGMIFATIIVLPVGIADAGSNLLGHGILGPAMAIAVLSSALPYTLEMFALTRMSARSFGILMSCEPAMGALVGLMLLGERLSFMTCVGTGLVILAHRTEKWTRFSVSSDAPVKRRSLG